MVTLSNRLNLFMSKFISVSNYTLRCGYGKKKVLAFIRMRPRHFFHIIVILVENSPIVGASANGETAIRSFRRVAGEA